MVLDQSNMKDVLLDFPAQCRNAIGLAQGIKITTPVTKVLVCGLGGSGISGDLLKSYVFDKEVPVFVVKDYTIPGFIDKKTLVFVVSYSGNTEESLSALTQAKNKGCAVVAITSGGKLADLTDTVIQVPNGLQPRNAVGYLFFPILGVIYNSGIIKIKNEELNEMLEIIKDTESYNEEGRNIALQIKDKTPIIYASSTFEVCAYRLKTQINENAKTPAYHHVFPELCHNEIVGSQGMERSKFIVFFIRDTSDHDRTKKRMDIIQDLYEHRVDVQVLKTRGDSLLARIFSMVYLGDWISYHLAMWKRVDPTPVYIVEELKRKLEQ